MIYQCNEQHGRVDKWLKKEGDRFTSTEPLCEVTISQDAVFDNYNDVQVMAWPDLDRSRM